MHLSRSQSETPNRFERDRINLVREGHSNWIKVLPIQHASGQGYSSSLSEPKEKFPGWTSRWFLWSKRFFPCLKWMQEYQWREFLKADILAGLTVGTMLIPQSLSYAKLAGLHPIYGLYAGFVPAFAYAIFGTSQQLAVGPVAMVSLLVSNALLPLIDLDKTGNIEETYVELAILLAFLVGIMECLMGLVRLGWIIRFISHSVISGFTTGSAVIIGLSQSKYLLGYEISQGTQIIPILASIADGFHQFMWQPFVMGSTMLIVLLLMKYLGKMFKSLRVLRVAGPLTSIVVGVLFVKLFRTSSITVVGVIPQGFPKFSYNFRFEYAVKLLPHAALICGVGILESVGIAKALAAKNGYEIDSNQELFGLGVTNILGSLFSAYPVTGSFSRSAVSHESGAKTGFYGIVVGTVVGGTLLYLTALFVDVPQCVLAAIIISAVLGLVDYHEASFLWRVEKKDFLLWAAACLFTLFFGIEIGVLIAVGLSLAFVIYESANPHIAVLGRLPGTTVYRNLQQYPDAHTYHGIVVIRIDSPMYFANINFIKDRLRKLELQAGTSSNQGTESNRIQFVILEMSPVTYIDSTAVHTITEIHEEYKSRNIQLALSNPNANVMGTLARAGIPDLIGRQWYFVRIHDAVQVCNSHLHDVPGTDVVEAAYRNVRSTWDSAALLVQQSVHEHECDEHADSEKQALLGSDRTLLSV